MINPGDRKINLKKELASMERYIAMYWNTGPELGQMLNEMYSTMQKYGKYWYSWSKVSNWVHDKMDERKQLLEEQWGEKHASGLSYFDVPLMSLEVFFSQISKIERELDSHNVEAYQYQFLTGTRYKKLKTTYPWLNTCKPIKASLENDHEFEGTFFRYATRPGFSEAIEYDYIHTNAEDTAHEELCTAIMVHLDSVHRHNQAIQLIQALDEMGLDNKSVYPLFTLDVQTQNPLAAVIKDIIEQRRHFVLHDFEHTDVKNIIAQFFNDPENSKPILESLLPYVEIKKHRNWDTANLVSRIEEKRKNIEMSIHQKGYLCRP